MARADRFTFKRATPVIFTDFAINFDRNPQTNSLKILVNEEAVSQRLKNILLIRPMEIPYSRMGSRIKNYLFGLFDDLDETKELVDEIKGAIQEWEPAVANIRVKAKFSPDDLNSLNINVIYDLVNVKDNIEFTTLIKKVR